MLDDYEINFDVVSLGFKRNIAHKQMSYSLGSISSHILPDVTPYQDSGYHAQDSRKR